jgi:hypothetical protein
MNNLCAVYRGMLSDIHHSRDVTKAAGAVLEIWSAAPHSSTVSSDRGELIWGAIGTKVRPCAGSCELSTVGIEASAGISFSSHSMKRESRASLLGTTQLRYEAGKRSPVLGRKLEADATPSVSSFCRVPVQCPWRLRLEPSPTTGHYAQLLP